LAIGLFRRNKFIEKTKQLVEIEKDRSDKLLLNILPEGTAKELKDNGKVTPQKFDSVTVMFTDFEAFTKYSQDLTPELLVKSVDYHFSKFDQIIEKYGLEKIKTIGDSYMCAGGLPIPTKDHAQKMLHAAFEIRDFIENIKSSEVREITHFNIRIGIHTGPVVAGVVGLKKFAYDIWGDTVNIASRLESNSEPGKINISENTYQLIKESFDCEYRGEIKAKNKGMMKMYYVHNKKEKSKPFIGSEKSEVPSNNNSQERAS
jgi:class 3 adenylate cyclase